MFKEDEVVWLKDDELHLQDGEYKTSKFLETFAIEIEDENLLNLILGVEKTAKEYLKTCQKKYNSWFYIEFSETTVFLRKEEIDFIKKWYYIRYLFKSESFPIRLYEPHPYEFKAIVNYTWTPDAMEKERILISTLEKFNSRSDLHYILLVGYKCSICDLNSYIHGEEPLYYSTDTGMDGYMYLKCKEQAYLRRINLKECNDIEGNEGASNEYDYTLVDVSCML